MTVRFHTPLAPDVSTRPPSLGGPPERGLDSSSVEIWPVFGPMDVRDSNPRSKILTGQISENSAQYRNRMVMKVEFGRIMLKMNDKG